MIELDRRKHVMYDSNLRQKRSQLQPRRLQKLAECPIENLRAIIKSRRRKKYGVPRTKDELVVQIFDIWKDIDTGLVHTLADSANKRFLAVLKARGKVTKYGI